MLLSIGATEDAVLGASSAARRHSIISSNPPGAIATLGLDGHDPA
jgi:hypothetical protein